MEIKKKYKICYYIRGWGFAAVVIIVFIIISSGFSASVITVEKLDSIVEIGNVQTVWKKGFPSLCWVNFFLKNLKINITICGDEVDIRVELKCEMRYETLPLFPREVCITLILHLDDPLGLVIGEGMATLNMFQKESILSVDGEFDSYENETRIIWCEVIVSPYIILFDMGPDFPVPWSLRIPCPYGETKLCYIEYDIIHKC